MPSRSAAPFPRFSSWRTANSCAADLVPSVDPSSTTIICAAGTAVLVRSTTSRIVATAWNAGMTTATPPRPARMSAPFENAEHRLELGAELLDGFGGQRTPRFGLELAGATVLLDLLARAFDRVFLGVQQVLHEHDQLDLAPLVHAIARAVLGGIEEAELDLQIAQHVRLLVGELADVADRDDLMIRQIGRS